MYPERMRWTEIFLLRSDLDRTIDHLHDYRIIQSLESSSRSDKETDPEYINVKGRMDKVIEFFAPMEKMDKGFFKKFLDEKETPLLIDSDTPVVHQARIWLDKNSSRIEPLRKLRSQLEEELNYIKEIGAKLKLLSGLDIDLLTISRLQRVRTKVGTTRRFEELKKIVAPTGADLDSSLLDKKEGLHSVRVIYTSRMKKEIEEGLRGRTFSEINIDPDRLIGFLSTKGKDPKILKRGPVEVMKTLEIIEENILSEQEALLEKGSEISRDLLDQARGFSEALQIEIEKDGLRRSLGNTVYTSRISGWVPDLRIKELHDIVSRSTKGSFHIATRKPTASEIKENKVPIKLKNGRLGTLFEPLTTTFAVPRYDEIDPSLFISIPFIFFFGLMLGDAGYGLLILLPSIFIFIKGKGSSTLRTMSTFGLLMGIATTIAGIWMGSFFGDLIPRLVLGDPEAKLYSLTILGVNLPYDTLRDPMLLFQMSLWLGFIQLNFGFLLLGYDRMKKGKIWGFMKGTFSWMLIQAGAIVFLGGILFGWWELAGPLPAFGGILFLSGSILLFFEIGFMFMFDIEGLVGDWISYTRILALGLSTFGLAMAFNIVGEMLMDIHVALVVVVAVLLVALHIFNLLLQTLGSAVHSIRLQFVEFFGRFYEGGGELFHPFGNQRYYSKIIPSPREGGDTK